jgi:hypothetical protein
MAMVSLFHAGSPIAGTRLQTDVRLHKVKVAVAFFAETTIKSNFLCNLGHGDASELFPRSPASP